ncbi:hypothetical protein B0H11DRAFT_2342813 [Mycena galericulata]|nr:hypothetical protein B0H11DRAFT_2342813 [Mycena galericulata]
MIYQNLHRPNPWGLECRALLTAYCARPFRLNQDGHNKYLSRISCYRRSEVVFDIATLNAAHENGLFLPNAIIQANGRAIVPANAIPTPPSVRTTLRADRPQATVKVPNFALTWRSGKGKQATYSPFTAKPHAEWQKSTRETLGFDVREDVNNTTLGLYSFRILVDCVWSAKFVAKAGVVPLGRRPTIKSGKSNSKRPRAEDIVKTGAPKKRRICLDEKENIECILEGLRYRHFQFEPYFTSTAHILCHGKLGQLPIGALLVLWYTFCSRTLKKAQNRPIKNSGGPYQKSGAERTRVFFVRFE